MLNVLRENLLRKPDQYLDEMMLFLWDEYQVMESASIVSGPFGVLNLAPNVRREPKPPDSHIVHQAKKPYSQH